MQYLANNIRFLRKKEGLTQEQLAVKLGIKRSLVGSYEEGRAEPKLQTLLAVCHYFKVSADDLLSKNLSEDKQRPEYDISGINLRVLPIAVNTNNEEYCTLVPQKAAAGYTRGYSDTEYIENLPQFSLPFPELTGQRSHRIFQISGESMLPIKPGSYIICEYVDDWSGIKNEHCYVLITKTDGIVYKRVINNLSEGELVLKSDNPEYKPYSVSPEEVLEVWKAKGYTSFELPDTERMSLEIKTLTQYIMQLKNDVELLKNKVLKNE